MKGDVVQLAGKNDDKKTNGSKKSSDGKIDIDAKTFMQDPTRFADAFNFFVFNGEQVIKPEDLTELDTTEIALPYGNNAREPIQKFRDILKRWTRIMRDDSAVYVFLGIENQAFIHYAIAVKNMLYDAMNYDKQVRNATKTYKPKKNKKVDEANSADNTVEIKAKGDEFPSGFRKEDKLIPVITLVIYFGAKKWDAPLSIKEMLSTKDKRILKYVQDYKINLIEPYELSPENLEKFTTDLGLALKFIKYSTDREALEKVVNQDERYQSLERDAFDLMNDTTQAGIKPIMRGDKVDMCAAIEAMKIESMKKGRVEGIDETNARVARDMIEDNEPLAKILKYSRLAENVIINIANSLGRTLVR